MDTAFHQRAFSDIRRDRFRGGDPFEIELCSYLELLAGQTATDIDSWTLTPFSDCEKPLGGIDRRIVNRVFFEQKEARLNGVEALAVAVSETHLNASIEIAEFTRQKIATFTGQYLEKMKAVERYNAYLEVVLKDAWLNKKEIYALEGRPATSILDAVNKLISEKFWVFESYKDGALSLVTAQDVVMSEINPSAGINRTVNLGKYLMRYDVKTASLKVLRHSQNILRDGTFYHPYIYKDGTICWGNAANTAYKLLAEGALYEVGGLLSALLVTYAPDATPYVHLYDFAKQSKRYDASHVAPTVCETCEESTEHCECCGICYQTESDCECCSHCETTRDACHCCPICNGDRNDCDCCQNCEQSEDRCDRCRVCDTHSSACGCCMDCNSTRGEINRNGHAANCPNSEAIAVENTPTEKTPF